MKEAKMLNLKKQPKENELEQNMIFVGTIYDTFEALEETLGKLKLEKPLFLTYIAKKAFAEEVFKQAAIDENQIYLSEQPKKQNAKQTLQ